MADDKNDSTERTTDFDESVPLFTPVFSNSVKRMVNQVRKQTHATTKATRRLWEQREELGKRVPVRGDVDTWIEERSGALRSLVERPDPTDLERLEKALTGVVAAIRQISDKRVRRITNLFIAKIGGAAAITGISGLVTAFGSASTGAAIASLSGAAATTAKLYWIGSLVGLGVAGGGVILTGVGVGLGVGAAWGAKRFLYGSPRTEEELQDFERAILFACTTLIAAIGKQTELDPPASKDEMRIVAKQALIPLVNQIDMHWSESSLKKTDEVECRSFQKTLSVLSQCKLRACKDEVCRIAIGALG